ncbi:unnamed protein product [Allacma fusca]|uniref:Phospholipase/carboxylesterase/thioesterase domain-containing protein n=1 Tax=Allacma fusca TaxID=39272 RepID=A0A8J2K8T1_9HEXA|nr:unnamed protein product [Allacma fusca]
MSIYTGLTGNFSLAGIVAMSGYIPAIETIKWEQVQTPPILQCHGELDAIVGFDIALATKDVFEQLEFPNFTFKSYKNTGHSASAQEIHDIKKFFARVLA